MKNRKIAAVSAAALMSGQPVRVFASGEDHYQVLEQSLVQTRIMLAVVTVVTVVLAAVIIYDRLKNRKISPPDTPKPENKSQSPRTVALDRKKEAASGTIFDSLSTRILFRESTERKIILTGVEDPEKVIELSSSRPAVIGRNQSMADAVIFGERSISQKHCRIFSRSSKVYVEDLDSLNHTFVDGEQITEETELFSGSVLKIGRVSFNVRIVDA